MGKIKGESIRVDVNIMFLIPQVYSWVQVCSLPHRPPFFLHESIHASKSFILVSSEHCSIRCPKNGALNRNAGDVSSRLGSY